MINSSKRFLVLEKFPTDLWSWTIDGLVGRRCMDGKPWKADALGSLFMSLPPYGSLNAFKRGRKQKSLRDAFRACVRVFVCSCKSW